MRLSPFAQPDPRRTAFLRAQPFAHRGLHGGAVVENSRAAWAGAIALGHGIECDVQAAADGTPFVFHDDDLARLAGRPERVAALAPAALDAIRLTGSDETIPRLTEMLAIVAGRVPLLIEIKADGGRVAQLCLAVRHALEGYRGPVAVMSFNPLVGRWFARHAARLTRGLVVSEEGKRGSRGAVERWLSLWQARADFLAYDVRDLPSRFAGRFRARGLPLLTWTVRSAAAEETAARYADRPIYERHP
ncbi:glycerophosphodiester phosphodiesterase family protein [Sphingomonas flavalba]|uniref:glycerophosphodiester phosphodiesterase family protein n=1 Tax=Sphingomonas flavalba TaxID=2559804 RepID=UPI0039E065F5